MNLGPGLYFKDEVNILDYMVGDINIKFWFQHKRTCIANGGKRLDKNNPPLSAITVIYGPKSIYMYPSKFPLWWIKDHRNDTRPNYEYINSNNKPLHDIAAIFVKFIENNYGKKQ